MKMLFRKRYFNTSLASVTLSCLDCPEENERKWKLKHQNNTVATNLHDVICWLNVSYEFEGLACIKDPEVDLPTTDDFWFERIYYDDGLQHFDKLLDRKVSKLQVYRAFFRNEDFRQRYKRELSTRDFLKLDEKRKLLNVGWDKMPILLFGCSKEEYLMELDKILREIK